MKMRLAHSYAGNSETMNPDMHQRPMYKIDPRNRACRQTTRRNRASRDSGTRADFPLLIRMPEVR